MFTMSVAPGKCNDSRKCFAKGKHVHKDQCKILRGKGYPDGECPFCKEHPDVTNGVRYPWNEQKEKACVSA